MHVLRQIVHLQDHGGQALPGIGMSAVAGVQAHLCLVNVNYYVQPVLF